MDNDVAEYEKYLQLLERGLASETSSPVRFFLFILYS